MDQFLFYGLFVLASFWVALEPGPGFVKLSTQVMGHGRVPALFTAFGMFVGALPFVLLAATGLSWLIEAMPNLLTLLKIAGGAYLLWLAFDLLRKREVTQDRQVDHEPPGAQASVKRFLGGFMLVLLNPRTLLFYSAFPPIFLNNTVELSASVQLLLLGLAVSSIFLLTDVIFVLAASRYGSKIWQGERARAIARYIGATALSVFGLRLLLDND